jgi:hypothetical protein
MVLLAAAGSVTSAGCTHNYYYGAVPAGCPPVVTAAPTGVEYGAVCEVPTQVVGGSTVVAGKTLQPAPTLSGPRPPKIVLSEPNGGSRFAWRRSDPDSGLPMTRVEGAVDDPSLTR